MTSPSDRIAPDEFNALIEIPKGSKVEDELDKETLKIPHLGDTRCRKGRYLAIASTNVREEPSCHSGSGGSLSREQPSLMGESFGS